MKIGIIGGGSVGLLFAYYLNQCHDITIYTRSVRQARVLQAKGLIFEKNGIKRTVPIKADCFTEWKGQEELAILAVKQYHLGDVLGKVKEKTNGRGSYLFLQNGMGHLKWLEDLRADNIYIGSVENGAYKISDQHVHHTGEGINRAAVFYEKHGSLLSKFIEPLPASFPFVVEDDYYEMLIKKLVVNAVINPLTAILKIPNGELISNPYYYQNFQSLFKEIQGILTLEDPKVFFEHVSNVCRKTAENRSSMLKDLEEGRKTEADAILGYLIEEAKKQNRHAPLIQNYFSLIKGREYGKGGV